MSISLGSSRRDTMKPDHSDIPDAQLRALVGPGSPFELVVGPDGLHDFRHAPLTLASMFRQGRSRACAADSEVLSVGSRSVTLRQLYAIADSLRAALPMAGQERTPGRVAIVLSDAVEWASALIAIVESGGAAILVPDVENDSQLSHYLNASRPDCVVIDAARPVSNMQMTNVTSIPWRAPENPLWRAESPDVPPGVTPNGEALIAFTSGSSGPPKGIRLSHRGIIAGLWNMMLSGAWVSRLNARHVDSSARMERPKKPGATLVIGPLAHIGVYAQLLLRLKFPGRLILMKSWEPAEALRIVIAENVTTVSGATAAMIMQLGELRVSGGPLSIETFNLFGSSLDADSISRITEAFPGCRVGIGYGMTETNGAIATSSGHELLLCPGSVGRVIPTVQIKITDRQDNLQPCGRLGRIHVRGSMSMLGYCSDCPSDEDFSRRWYFTGDLGYLDDSGRLTVVDRDSNSGHICGVMVFATVIETLIRASGVAVDCAALVLPDSATILIWIVKAASHRSATSIEDLGGHLAAQLNVPPTCLQIFYVDVIPLTASGKADRQSLRSGLPTPYDHGV